MNILYFNAAALGFAQTQDSTFDPVLNDSKPNSSKAQCEYREMKFAPLNRDVFKISQRVDTAATVNKIKAQ